MYKVLVNYNFTPDKEWIGDDYLMYDRSDDGIDHLQGFDKSKIIKTTNVGNVDYDKISYLVDNYFNLPDIFIWGKSNLPKYVDKEQMEILDSYTEFTPLLSQNHPTYNNKLGAVCYYSGGMYHEINNSWYAGELSYRIPTFSEFAKRFNIPNPKYLPFAPGGNYVLTKERVHRYGVDMYDEMRQILPHAQNPAEAHMCERAYFLLWS